MTTLSCPEGPRGALGLLSLVLGATSLLFFFLPVLGVPIGACGLLAGLVGTALVSFGAAGLRWSLAGVAACVLALATNLAIAYAPAGYVSDYKSPPLWQTPPDRPFVPPPARPGR